MGPPRARAGDQGVGAIRFVVPFGADGASDRAARALARALPASPAIENRPGAGGRTGLERANALAAAGEPVLLLSTPTTHVLLPARLGREAAPHERFSPMAGLGAAPNVLLVPPALGVRSVEALVARARRERLTYASAGEGQTIHVCSAWFCALAGIEMAHRPYDRGSATAYEDFCAGRVHMYFDSLLGCRERIASNEALALAVSSGRRSAALPEVPTLRELGFEGYALEVWLGVFIANGALDERPLVADEALARSLGELGLEGGPRGRAAFAAEVEASRGPWLRALAAARQVPRGGG